MKLYEEIKMLLIAYPELRDSDRKLIWEIWKRQGVVKGDALRFEDFMLAALPENIRRTRQKIQEKFEGLRSSVPVQEIKKDKQHYKGTFAYRSTAPVFDEETRTVRFK